MASYPGDIAVTDYIAGFLLRYFRSAVVTALAKPYIDAARDRDLLRLHWAVSPSVRNLVAYVLEHRHEIQSVLTTALRIEDSVVRGRIDAHATVLRRRMSGLPTIVVGREPRRSYESGPNHVLAWVLMQAWALATRFAAMLPDSASYRETVDAAVQSLERVQRIQILSEMTGQLSAARRPAAGAVLEARRSRRELYRRAHDAYELLIRLEGGEPETITALLRATLLAPLEPWRRYELAVAFGAAEALAKAGNAAPLLNLLIGDTKSPIVRVGRFSMFWQSVTELYQAPMMEPSEAVTRHILDAYGLPASSDRPDVVVVDSVAGRVVSIIEVKYLTAEDASDRVRSAVAQIVRYARGYRLAGDTGPLLGRSLVAVSQGMEAITMPEPIPEDVPLITDFAAIQNGQLSAWVSRLHP